LTYLGFYIGCLASVWYWLNNPAKIGEKKVQYSGTRRVKTEIDVEEATWRSSWLGWLCCSWATNWVASWGSSGVTKINPDDLPQMGGKDQQARECVRLFEKLWDEEVQAKGVEKASLFSVIVQMWTVRTMLILMLILGMQQMITNLYTVVLIEQAMIYFIWLQTMRYSHPDHEISLTLPILCVIATFSTVPFMNCILSSLAHNIARRLDQRVSGALCVAVFQKAQRLPTSYLQGTSAAGDQADGSDSGEKASVQPQRVDMMQLIGYDIMGNLQGAYFQVCMLGTSLTAILIFSVMLWMRLGRATLVALAVAAFVLLVLGIVSGKMGQNYAGLIAVSDRRVQAVREMLQGIRVVKCYAWEEAMEGHINKLRSGELSYLDKYWHSLGVVTATALMFPRFLVISALAAFSAMYGTHSVSNILVCMQILYYLKASCEGVGLSLGRSVIIQPSLQRIEAFLKIAEAPVLFPGRVPDWVEVWKKPGQAAEEDPPHLRLRGSFRWTDGGPNALHELDLDIGRGELVGIVGKIGSGKSTLLQAVLGELYPDAQTGRALLSRPEVIAYCPQVPHIAEGTLKSNVLFGQDFDQARYDQAIAAASLVCDLKVLPGGDLVPIGSRGITLSGGQKARVSMARAAYHSSSDVVLIDDPFGSVDAATAKVLFEELLLGPLMCDRTRVVVLQPDVERLRCFDRVVLVEDGRIREQGPPEEVLQTEGFQSILSSHTAAVAEGETSVVEKTPSNSIERIREDNRTKVVKLREEERECRPTWHMIKQYCRIGRWRNIVNCCILFCMQTVMYMFCDLVLANWTNAIASDPEHVNQGQYIAAYVFWAVLGSTMFPICWRLGMNFTLNVSRNILGMMLTNILNAPIDKFFDKHPIGRIMNRMVSDIAAIDFNLFSKTTGTLAMIYYTMIPICYVHFIVPWFITILALPLYYIIGALCRRYWNTTVPLKYCAANARSEVNNILGDVTHCNAVIRAYGEQERLMLDMCDAIDNELKAVLYGERVLRRWLINRIMFLWSFFTTSMYIVGLMNTDSIGAGTLGLCLSMLLVIEALIEPNLDSATGAQMEFISLARIHEYLSIPQEQPRWLDHDARYRNFAARVRRADLGRLVSRGQGASLELFLVGAEAPLVRASKDGCALEPTRPGFSSLAELCPDCPELAGSTDWHRIVAVNEVVGDAEGMARELCEGSGEWLLLEVRSGWLSEGAKVEIENLRVGYADMQRDVLKGISLTFAPKSKVGIVGTTGCGKSSLLWAMLRILEPRAGRILLDGVDTRDVGLGTLRRVLGLVPQDPVLFTGTLRHNLDPLGHYSDGRLHHALELAQLSELVRSWAAGLDHAISDDGLSFGQRQLVCLARMVLRRPPLLLLDEATSAIDPRTQEIVQQTINEAFAGSTVVAVAHRLETILDFDHVCVLELGEVVEQGPVTEVAQLKGGHLNRMLAARGRS